MKEEWENLLAEMDNLKEELESLLEMVPLSAKFHKKTSSLKRIWKRLQRSVNQVDQFITPVKSVKVASPLLCDPDFKASWQMWKDYLNEQHGIVIRSRSELMGLKRLAEISDGKPELAIKYLEFAISRPTDKNFYKVNEVEMPVDNKEEAAAKKVIRLPAQYISESTNKNKSVNEQ